MSIGVFDTPVEGVFDFEAYEYVETSLEVTDDLGHDLTRTLSVRYFVGDTYFSDSTGTALPCALRTDFCHWTPSHQARPNESEERLFAMDLVSDDSGAYVVRWHAEVANGDVLADGEGADVPLESLKEP